MSSASRARQLHIGKSPNDVYLVDCNGKKRSNTGRKNRRAMQQKSRKKNRGN